MTAALYARVSTINKGQDPLNQLFHLREFVKNKGIENVEEYIDFASAIDLKRRTEYRRMNRDIQTGRIKQVFTYKLDRIARSLMDLELALMRWESRNVNLVIVDLGIDTSTKLGKIFAEILAMFAGYERDLIRERTEASIERRKSEGKPIGPAKIEVARPELLEALPAMLMKVLQGSISQVKAAIELGIPRSTYIKKFKEWNKENDEGTEKY